MSWKEVTRVTLSKKKDEQSPDDALSGPFFLLQNDVVLGI